MTGPDRTGSDLRPLMSDLSHLQSLLGFRGRSSKLEIRPDLFGGIGVFAYAPIKQGELLLAEEPLVSVTDEELLQNPWYGQEGSDYEALALKIVQTSLFSSTESLFPREHLHQLATPISSKVYPTLRNHLDEQAIATIIRRIELNSITFSTFPELVTSQNNHLSSSGIFIEASNFNHSCRPNAFRYSLGEVLVIRAARDINPEEQITLSYIPNACLFENKELRQEWLQGRDFVCKCEACEAEDQERGIPCEPGNSSAPLSILESPVFQAAQYSYRLDLTTRAEINLMEPGERIESIEGLFEDEDSAGLSFDDLISLLICRALTYEHLNLGEETSSKASRSLQAWLDAQSVATRVLPEYDFLHAVVQHHLSRVSRQASKSLKDWLWQFMRIPYESQISIFRFEGRLIDGMPSLL